MDFIAEHYIEVFIGVIFIVGIVIVALNKIGWLDLGETKMIACLDEREKPFPECVQGFDKMTGPLNRKMDDTLSRVIKLETGQSFVKARLEAKGEKIDKISDDVAYIRGYLEKNKIE